MDMSLPQVREGQNRKVYLKELSQSHRTVAALLAQGVDRVSVAAACGISPEYVTWLGGDPLFIQYVREMCKLAETQLESMFVKSVDIISEQMSSGSGEDKLKAARLQMEATGRVGKDRRSHDDTETPDHLEVLAQRLVKLLHNTKERTLDGESTVVQQE
jgi:hypothetical protein